VEGGKGSVGQGFTEYPVKAATGVISLGDECYHLKETVGGGDKNPQEYADNHFKGCVAVDFRDWVVFGFEYFGKLAAQHIEDTGLYTVRSPYSQGIPNDDEGHHHRNHKKI
jgi:hypothetical protein